jgi:hypothetical protein
MNSHATAMKAAGAAATLEAALRAALDSLCGEAGWPLARLTWLGEDARVELWTVGPGLESVRAAWAAAGARASWAARVAAAGRPLHCDLHFVPPDFADRAREAGLRYAIAFPLFDGEEVAGAVEVCAKEAVHPDALVRIGIQLGTIAHHKRRDA